MFGETSERVEINFLLLDTTHFGDTTEFCKCIF